MRCFIDSKIIKSKEDMKINSDKFLAAKRKVCNCSFPNHSNLGAELENDLQCNVYGGGIILQLFWITSIVLHLSFHIPKVRKIVVFS